MLNKGLVTVSLGMAGVVLVCIGVERDWMDYNMQELVGDEMGSNTNDNNSNNKVSNDDTGNKLQ